MRATSEARATIHPRVHPSESRRWLVVVTVALAMMLIGSGAAEAQESAASAETHSLGVNLQFPDEGIVDDEQLCVALFAGSSPDLSHPPLLSRCLDPGQSAVSFEGLQHGEFSVLLPGPGSELEEERYQGQLVSTSIPDDAQLDAFGIDIAVGLAPEYTGTTGRVQVSVFGCPAGTNGGQERDGWADECQAMAGGVPLTLSGTGSINDAAFQAVTGLSGNGSGSVEFTNLPAGAYELDSELPENVSDAPALFVESSIDGSLGAIDPNETLALRPTETVAVDVYLVIDPDDAAGGEPPVGLADPVITGGIAAG